MEELSGDYVLGHYLLDVVIKIGHPVMPLKVKLHLLRIVSMTISILLDLLQQHSFSDLEHTNVGFKNTLRRR